MTRSPGLTIRGIAALALATVATVTACDPVKEGVEKIKLGDREFTLKTALDDQARSRGLGGVSELPENGGMIFVFPDAQMRSFWMKDCTVDLDIAFLDARGFVTVVWTMPKESPQGKDETLTAYEKRLKTYSSQTPAQFAIEIVPGTFGKLGIKRGSKIELDLPKLKAAAK